MLKQDKTLCYYDNSDYHSAKPQKTIELTQVINLIDGGSKEHAFGIETAERTYYITAASSEEKRYEVISHLQYWVLCKLLYREWLETLRVVRSMSAEKIKRIMEREVDPRNALGSIDLDNIDQVVAADQIKRCVCVHTKCTYCNC